MGFFVFTHTPLVTSLALVSLTVSSYAQGVDHVGEQRLNQEARQQLQGISGAKGSRRDEQQKIDSQLLYALKQKRGETLGVPSEPIKLDLDAKGRALVDISGKVSPRLTLRIRKLGGIVVSKFEAYDTVRARLALEKLEALARMDHVRFIMPAVQPMNNDGAITTKNP
jgi:hypothetical protein